MTTKRRSKGTRRKRSKRTKRKVPPVLYGLILLAAGVALYFLATSFKGKPTPIRPKVPPVSAEVVRSLAEAALFERGITRQRISITPSELQVALPKGFKAEEFIGPLKKRLRRAFPELELKTWQSPKGQRLEVRAYGEVLLRVLFYHPPEELPRVSVVVDDLGRDLQVAEVIMALGQPLTLALLPLRQHTQEIAEEAHRRGYELLLHMPMEPRGYPLRDPGEGALFVSMDEQRIKASIERCIEALPYVQGVNNHMGSRFMEHADKVAILMEELRAHGLFFLDSLTTPRSKGLSVAKEVGVTAIERDVFLDNAHDEEDFMKQWRLLIQRARHRGKAVGICHPYPSTVKALAKALAGLDGVELVPLSWTLR